MPSNPDDVAYNALLSVGAAFCLFGGEHGGRVACPLILRAIDVRLLYASMFAQ